MPSNSQGAIKRRLARGTEVGDVIKGLPSNANPRAFQATGRTMQFEPGNDRTLTPFVPPAQGNPIEAPMENAPNIMGGNPLGGNPNMGGNSMAGQGVPQVPGTVGGPQLPEGAGGPNAGLLQELMKRIFSQRG